MQQKKKKFMRYCKLEKTFDSFGEGIYDILQFKPNMKKILFPNKEIDGPEDITKKEFYQEFPNVISKFNPMIKNDKGKFINILWEFHLAHSKFHIKTNNYFSMGMQETAEHKYIFYLTLFGNFDIDKEYLNLNGWKEQENIIKNKDLPTTEIPKDNIQDEISETIEEESDGE